MKKFLTIFITITTMSCTSKYILNMDTSADDFRSYSEDLTGTSGNLYLQDRSAQAVTITNFTRDSVTFFTMDSSVHKTAVQNIHYFRHKNHWRGGLDIFLVGAGLGAAVALVSTASNENPNSMGEIPAIIPGLIFGVLASPIGFLAGHSYEYYFKFPVQDKKEQINE